MLCDEFILCHVCFIDPKECTTRFVLLWISRVFTTSVAVEYMDCNYCSKMMIIDVLTLLLGK